MNHCRIPFFYGMIKVYATFNCHRRQIQITNFFLIYHYTKKGPTKKKHLELYKLFDQKFDRQNLK